MEYLLLFYLDGLMEQEDIEELRYYKAVNTMEMYVGQAAISEFESSVFRLPEEELTTENINRLYLESLRRLRPVRRERGRGRAGAG